MAFCRSPARSPRRVWRRIRSARTSSTVFDRGEWYAFEVHVLIAVADVGSGVQLEEVLNRAGFEARWDGAQAEGPRGASDCEVAVLDADHLGVRLAEVANLWRD